jgi:hypothetical protein
MKCPGRERGDSRPNAVFEAACPACGASVEFFADDESRKCFKCGHRFGNPRLDTGSADAASGR